MSYQVLARKWRPKFFSEVVGQEHVLRVLINSIAHNKLHHAYLFVGTRGVGKTTIARILAKCLNCETNITSQPCGKCSACIEIGQGRFVDLIEVDAASRTKVEDTRELLDNVQYLPARGRFKVYIIDEVHMLSGHSFNALLKTLEEPPEHVKFLLATTDPQKLPITVLSRCLQFNLKALSPDFIQKHLQNILTYEKIEYDLSATRQLAFAANGSIRDSLSLLDQAIVFGGGRVIAKDVEQMLGVVDASKIFALLNSIASANANEALSVISQLADLAVDFMNALNELLEILHRIAVIQQAHEINTDSWQYLELIRELSGKIEPSEVQLYYQICLMGKKDILLAPSMRLGFEMIVLRMLAFCPAYQEDAAACGFLEKTVGNEATKCLRQNNGVISSEAASSQAFSSASSVNIDTANLLSGLGVTGLTKTLVHNCIVTKIEQGIVELLLDPSCAAILNSKHEERINKALSEKLNRAIKVNINIGSKNMDTQANIVNKEVARKQDQARQSITEDNTVKKLIDKFDAKIIFDPVLEEEI